MKIVLVVAVSLVLGWACQARCWWCPSYDCYGSGACGNKCVCIKPQGSMAGYCASIE